MNLPETFDRKEVFLGFHTSTEMKQVWAKELEMAKLLLDVCKRHDLKIWMEGGTLLGAVRHKGFIPWDDDIDFIMPRKDYDRLVQIADREFAYPFVFQTTYSEDDYYQGHAQLRNAETTCLSRNELERKYCRGLDVDIFVYDGVVTNPVLMFFHRTSTMLIKKFIRAYLERNVGGRKLGKRVMSVVSSAVFSFVSYKKAFAAYESLFRMVDADKCEWMSHLAWRYKRKFWKRTEDYKETVWLPFEDTEFPAPKGYENVLRNHYGKNYMTPLQLPTFHGQKFMDAMRPYTEVVEELKENPALYDERVALLYSGK